MIPSSKNPARDLREQQKPEWNHRIHREIREKYGVDR